MDSRHCLSAFQVFSLPVVILLVTAAISRLTSADNLPAKPEKTVEVKTAAVPMAQVGFVKRNLR